MDDAFAMRMQLELEIDPEDTELAAIANGHRPGLEVGHVEG